MKFKVWEKTVLVLGGTAIIFAFGAVLSIAVSTHNPLIPNTVAIAPPVPQPIPDPIPNSPQFLDFDDLAGLDRETQAMLEERRRQDRSDQQRLERIEWNIRVLNHRMFGASVIVPAGRSPRGGLGQVGEMPLEALDFEPVPESETILGDGPQPEPEQ